MDFRHEWKHEITVSDMIAIRHRLRAVAKIDPNAIDGKYFIRSLYFDNLSDKVLREKLDGVNMREKFRIRYYNGDTSLIHLEKKSKWNGLGSKQSDSLTREEGHRGWRSGLDAAVRPAFGAGAVQQNESTGPAAKDHCGLHP